MLGESLEARRGKVVGRIRQVRKSYEVCVKDVLPDVANRGSEWSIADLLRHVMGGYGGMLTRLLEEDGPNLGGRFDLDEAWKRATAAALEHMDQTIVTASGLTAEQLGRTGQRDGQSIGVLDVLSLMADHYLEHLNQLIDEVRPREGLPRL